MPISAGVAENKAGSIRNDSYHLIWSVNVTLVLRQLAKWCKAGRLRISRCNDALR